MNQNSASREKRLLAFLPAALVLAIYAFFLAMPAQREYSSKLNQLAAAKLSASNQEAADSARENLELAQTGLRRLNQQILRDRNQLQFLARNWTGSETMLPTVKEVNELLQQFNLSIVRQEFESEPPLSDYLKELETMVMSYAESENIEYWKIELAGSYADMMKFLQQVKTSGLRTYPITLSMKTDESANGNNTWTIVFVV